MNFTRTYLRCTRSIIAKAYGYSQSRTIMEKLQRAVDKMEETDPLIKQLGVYTGGESLWPDQVEAIVKILGTPQEPELLYKEQLRS